MTSFLLFNPERTGGQKPVFFCPEDASQPAETAKNPVTKVWMRKSRSLRLFKGFAEDGLHEVFGELFAVFDLLF